MTSIKKVAGMYTQISFKLTLKPFKGTDEASKYVREIRGRVSTVAGQNKYAKR